MACTGGDVLVQLVCGYLRRTAFIIIPMSEGKSVNETGMTMAGERNCSASFDRKRKRKVQCRGLPAQRDAGGTMA
jgi:hypothetical protein